MFVVCSVTTCGRLEGDFDGRDCSIVKKVSFILSMSMVFTLPYFANLVSLLMAHVSS